MVAKKNVFADHRSWQDVVLADRETVTSGPGTTLAQLEGFPEQYSEQKEKHVDKEEVQKINPK